MSSPKQHRQGPGHRGVFGGVRRGEQRIYRHGTGVQKERVRLFTRVQDVDWRHGRRRNLLPFDIFCLFRKIRLYQPSKVCRFGWKMLDAPATSSFSFSVEKSLFFFLASFLNPKDEPCALFRETCLHAHLFSCSRS